MSVTRSPHPCPLSITSSLMLQHECNAVSTHPHHQASHKLTLHPRLNATTTSPHVPCLPRFTGAHNPPPTHMRTTLRICVATTLLPHTSPHPSNPISVNHPRICVSSHAYA
ncbi:hypothetical protein PIB30_107619, partial [Stylosanthes scabra]|nr:hypothetical protein [Stylosanthes scabra]